MTQQDAPDSKPYSFNSLLDISSFASTLATNTDSDSFTNSIAVHALHF